MTFFFRVFGFFFFLTLLFKVDTGLFKGSFILIQSHRRVARRLSTVLVECSTQSLGVTIISNADNTVHGIMRSTGKNKRFDRNACDRPVRTNHNALCHTQSCQSVIDTLLHFARTVSALRVSFDGRNCYSKSDSFFFFVSKRPDT